MDKISFYFNQLLKILLFIAVIYFAYLYFTRPELNLSQEYFTNIMQNNNYKVYYNKERIPGAKDSLVARKDDIDIYYVNFYKNEDAKKYYENYTQSSEKHLLNMSRDFRLDKIAAEKQYYSDDDIFYIAMYANNAVVYSKTYENQKEELKNIFSELYKPAKFDWSNIKGFFEEKFDNAI